MALAQWAIPVIAVAICGLAVTALLLSPSPEVLPQSGDVDAEPSLDPWDAIIAQARMILGEPLAVLVEGSLGEPADGGERYAQFMRLSVALAAFRLVAELNGEWLARNWLISNNGVAGEAPVDQLYRGRYADVMAAAEALVVSQ
jgi:hypothetical protein